MDSLNLSSQVSAKHFSAPHLRNPAMFSKQNVKNLSTISEFLDFRQNNWDYSLLLSLPNVRNLDMPSTCAQMNTCMRPTSKVLIQFAQAICSPHQSQHKLNVCWSFSTWTSHLNSTRAGPTLLKCRFAAYMLQNVCINSWKIPDKSVVNLCLVRPVKRQVSMASTVKSR